VRSITGSNKNSGIQTGVIDEVACKQEVRHGAKRNRPNQYHLLAIAIAVALSRRIMAVAWFGEFAVGANAGLRVHAPEQPIIARGHGRIGFRVDEQPFPAQGGTQVRVAGIKAFAFGLGNHAAPPVFPVCTSGTVCPDAMSSARLTATVASLIL
jgi:hypothetical protein